MAACVGCAAHEGDSGWQLPRGGGAVGVGGVSHSHAQNMGPCITVLGLQSSSPQQDLLLGPEMPKRETGEERSKENRNQWSELALLPEQRNSTDHSILASKRN